MRKDVAPAPYGPPSCLEARGFNVGSRAAFGIPVLALALSGVGWPQRGDPGLPFSDSSAYPLYITVSYGGPAISRPRNSAPYRKFAGPPGGTESTESQTGRLPGDEISARDRSPDPAGIVGYAGPMALTLVGTADIPRSPERNSDLNLTPDRHHL